MGEDNGDGEDDVDYSQFLVTMRNISLADLFSDISIEDWLM